MLTADTIGTTTGDTTTTGEGGATHDLKNGWRGGADVYGASAADTLRGTPYADFLQGGRGQDRMFGGAGKDYVDGVDGKAANDTLNGGLGTDHCVGDKGDTFKGCEGHVVKVGVPSAS
jgi:Ca2+-binding RTX toxin-like protein